MPREVIEVRIVRNDQVPDGLGGYLDTGEVDIPGSPFQARLFRGSNQVVRIDGAAGTSTIEGGSGDRSRVLTILSGGAQVKPGDVALIPACEGNGGEPERATIRRPRFYSRRVECDLETGNGRTTAGGQ